MGRRTVGHERYGPPRITRSPANGSVVPQTNRSLHRRERTACPGRDNLCAGRSTVRSVPSPLSTSARASRLRTAGGNRLPVEHEPNRLIYKFGPCVARTLRRLSSAIAEMVRSAAIAPLESADLADTAVTTASPAPNLARNSTCSAGGPVSRAESDQSRHTEALHPATPASSLHSATPDA